MMMKSSRALIGLIMLLSLLGSGLAQDPARYEFGVVPFFKNYPEFKRGADPYANLSGTVQENVDLYSGKLNVSFQLPGIPWSETAAFAPVLLYNSNIWSYCAPVSSKFEVGGDLQKAGPLPPPDINKPDFKLPDYWGNDAWVRFSPIGRPHAMPGWTLTTGGVYTEYIKAAAPLDSLGFPADCLKWVMEKKYFIAPDGSSHLLVELETSSRPYFGLLGVTAPETLCTTSCQLLPGHPFTTICLPKRYAAGGATRIWHSVDGSFYYYVESQAKVYAKDGTCFELETATGSSQGMIKKITDRDGNAVTVTWTDGTMLVGGVTKNCRKLKYAGPGGASLTVYFLKQQLTNYLPDGSRSDIDILLLKRVEAPRAGSGSAVVTYEFEYALLGAAMNPAPPSGTIVFRDLFQNTILACTDMQPMDIGDRVFSDDAPPPAGARNAQIYVLTEIKLPNTSSAVIGYRFEYNQAGKLSRIVYPDGGARRYQYGNTLDPSTFADDCHGFLGWPALLGGEAPFGGVSLVYQNTGGGDVLERAYAYSGYNVSGTEPDGNKYVQTLSCLGDGGIQIHQYFESESMTENREILQFGLPYWRTGKLARVKSFDRTTKSLDNATFRQYFLRVDAGGQPAHYPFQTVRDFLITNPAVGLKREEETTYQNYDAGWHWTLPASYCTTSGCSQYPIGSFYSAIIPSGASTWSSPPYSGYYMPEWNTVVTQKLTKVYEGGGAPLTSKVVYTWGDVANDTGAATERQAALLAEAEYNFSSSTTSYRTKNYTYFDYWPASPAASLPARALGLPLQTTIKAGSTQVAATKNVYRTTTDSQVNARKDFRPIRSQAWKTGSTWTRTDYTCRTAEPVRLQTVSSYNGSALVNKIGYDYDTYGLLKRVDGYLSTDTTPTLYMCLEYDRYTGLPLKRLDRNGDRNGDKLFSSSGDDYVQFGYDACNRLADVKLRHGGADRTLAQWTYSATMPFTVIAKEYKDDSGNYTESTTRNDTLDRPAFTWTTIGTGSGTAKESFVRKDFDVLGRLAAESFPKEVAAGNRDTSYPNLSGTLYAYDSLGRLTTINRPTPDGSGTCSSSIAYSVNATLKLAVETVTDEMSRYRKIYRDAFGRIMRVDEQAPVSGADLITRYTYDVLDNLTKVDKRGAGDTAGQIRNFSYDALSRLLYVQLPEYNNEFLHYGYDDQGNVLSRSLRDTSSPASAALGWEEGMTYDSFGRLKTRSTSLAGVTTAAQYDYDATAKTPPAGFAFTTYRWGRLVRDRLTHADGVAVERFFDYEWHGQPRLRADVLGTASGDTVTGQAFLTGYACFDRTGIRKQLTYPSGRVVDYAYGTGGVLAGIRQGGSAIFDGLDYAPHGGVEAMTLRLGGYATSWRQTFNGRLWPEHIKTGTGIDAATSFTDPRVLFGLEYPAARYELNGNIQQANRYWRQTAGANRGTLEFNYGYDRLNRLASADCTLTPPGGGAQSAAYDWTMDEFGNITTQDKSGGSPGWPGAVNLAVDRATNRLGGKLHDVAGNLLESSTTGVALNFAYLDQGHIREVKNGAGLTLYRYWYDADGKRRIKAKAGGNGSTSITADCSYYFYEGEDLIGQQDRGALAQPEESYAPKFLLLDHLGTTRAELTFPGGAPTVAQIYDAMPYGELIDAPVPPDEQVIFTGKPIDTESGLVFFGARYYSGTAFRWISPDRPFADAAIDFPAKWNLYGYCSASPINKYDNNGRAEGIFNKIVDVAKATSKAFNLTVNTGIFVELPGGKLNLCRTEQSVVHSGQDRVTGLGINIAGFGLERSWPAKVVPYKEIERGVDAFDRPWEGKVDKEKLDADTSQHSQVEVNLGPVELAFDMGNNPDKNSLGLSYGAGCLIGLEASLNLSEILKAIDKSGLADDLGRLFSPPTTNAAQSSIPGAVADPPSATAPKQ